MLTPASLPHLTSRSGTTRILLYISQTHRSYHAELEDDWHKAINILRQFSVSTYSLQWLNLEGCTWLKALTFRGDNFGSSPQTHADDTWNNRDVVLGPDWNDAWRQVTYISVVQGWIHADKRSKQTPQQASTYQVLALFA